MISPSPELVLLIVKPNSLANISEFPLNATVKCPPQFSISTSQFTLDPGEAMEFDVTFRTDFEKDSTSQLVEGNIAFTFVNSPQTALLPAKASMIFPNVQLSTGKIDFGSMMQHAEQGKVVTVTNSSEVDLDFVWELLPERTGDYMLKIFDVCPIRGHIEQGDLEDVHFRFFALGGGEKGKRSKYSDLAICHVIGGPDYTLSLKGSSADIEYRIALTLLNFGDRFHGDRLSGSITLQNISDVPLAYRLNVPKHCTFLNVSIDGTNGTLSTGQQQQFEIQIIPGLPRK
jgi:hypothetical protein